MRHGGYHDGQSDCPAASMAAVSSAGHTLESWTWAGIDPEEWLLERQQNEGAPSGWATIEPALGGDIRDYEDTDANDEGQTYRYRLTPLGLEACAFTSNWVEVVP